MGAFVSVRRRPVGGAASPPLTELLSCAAARQTAPAQPPPAPAPARRRPAASNRQLHVWTPEASKERCRAAHSAAALAAMARSKSALPVTLPVVMMEVMMLVPVLVLVLGLVSVGPSRVDALIEPRLDRPRWWVPPTNPTDGRSFPAAPKVSKHSNRSPHAGHASRPQKDEPQEEEQDREESLPAYIFSEHNVGPKPPPGYSFSAGPKPARFPKPSQDATPAPPRPTDTEVTVVEATHKHLWPKSRRRYGGARPRSGGGRWETGGGTGELRILRSVVISSFYSWFYFIPPG